MEEKTRSTAWRVKRAANERKRAPNASLRSLQAGSVPEVLYSVHLKRSFVKVRVHSFWPSLKSLPFLSKLANY